MKMFVRQDTIISEQNMNISRQDTIISELKSDNTGLKEKIFQQDTIICELKSDNTEIKTNNIEIKSDNAGLKEKIFQQDTIISEQNMNIFELKIDKEYALFLTAIQDANAKLLLETAIPKLVFLSNLRKERNKLNHYINAKSRNPRNNDSEDVVNFKLAVLRIKLNSMSEDVRNKLEKRLKYEGAIKLIKAKLDSLSIISCTDDIHKIKIDDNIKDYCLDYWGLSDITEL